MVADRGLESECWARELGDADAVMERGREVLDTATASEVKVGAAEVVGCSTVVVGFCLRTLRSRSCRAWRTLVEGERGLSFDSPFDSELPILAQPNGHHSSNDQRQRRGRGWDEVEAIITCRSSIGGTGGVQRLSHPGI